MAEFLLLSCTSLEIMNAAALASTAAPEGASVMTAPSRLPAIDRSDCAGHIDFRAVG